MVDMIIRERNQLLLSEPAHSDEDKIVAVGETGLQRIEPNSEILAETQLPENPTITGLSLELTGIQMTPLRTSKDGSEILAREVRFKLRRPK